MKFKVGDAVLCQYNSPLNLYVGIIDLINNSSDTWPIRLRPIKNIRSAEGYDILTHSLSTNERELTLWDQLTPLEKAIYDIE